MYDKSLVIEVIFGICKNNIDDLLKTLKLMRDDLK